MGNIFNGLSKEMLNGIYISIGDFEKNSLPLKGNIIPLLKSKYITDLSLFTLEEKISYLKVELYEEISRRYFNTRTFDD